MSSKADSFRGSFVALVTPFTSKGRIDRKALRDLVEWQIMQGTDGIVCCGSTGEGATLTRADRKAVLATCLEASDGRIPVVAGTGTCSTAETVLLTLDALRAGAQGALVVTPYYNRPTQRGCLEHFREVAKAGLPVIVYHNPMRAVFRFSLDTVRELGEIQGIAAFKDSSGSIEFVRQFKKATNLPLLSGDDDLTYETILEGGVGAISVIGNLIPKRWKRMIEFARAKDPMGAAIAKMYLPLIQSIFIETNPQCIKYLASQVGICKPYWRLPLLPPSIETKDKMKRVLIQMCLPHFIGIKSQLAG